MFIWNIIRLNLKNKEYYPQIFLEECRYLIKNRKMINTIKEDLELNESDDESDDE